MLAMHKVTDNQTQYRFQYPAPSPIETVPMLVNAEHPDAVAVPTIQEPSSGSEDEV